MEALATLFLYILRFMVIISVVVLWTGALGEIENHARDGSFAAAKLATMAIAISVVAVGAIAASYAVIPFGRLEAESPKTASALPARQGCEDHFYSFTYAFGLERPAPVSEDCSEVF
jgi:hypothetical protein